ncbi:MAG TPA: threonine synthase [Candidatus Bathyarchaeota archaeon]|nr:threonine synthase [Candidatus Bathyarchaeota archaeon]
MGCGQRYSPNEIIYTCRKCGDLLTVDYDWGRLGEGEEIKEKWAGRPRLSVWRYRELLPVADERNIISLGEGGTNLYDCRRLGGTLGVRELQVKNEGENPTGSFKDRGMTVGVSRALELGARGVICASTGNTSASLAAYSARAGLDCLVVVPAGKIALGKLAQAMMYGAKVVAVNGNFDDALSLVMDACTKLGLYLLNSVNAYRLEGQKTIGFELIEQRGWRLPDWIVLPVGNAGNISAIWKGVKELRRLGIIDEAPRMAGVQAEGAAPIANAVKQGWLEEEIIEFVDKPETIATAIRIGRPVNWKKALRAIRESKGTAVAVSDSEIVEAQKLLARLEGVFVEPASAASIAGLRRLLEEGIIDRDESVVCITTGHGLKDPEEAVRVCEKPLEIEPRLSELEAILR